MKEPEKCAQAMVKILESEGVKYIFGHPGEQILPFYDALRKSKIKHVLMRHEQGAAHAADAYARISGKFGVCVASAGPGALNLVMGVATAYKDSVPLLVITGDVPTDLSGSDVFQEVDTPAIFKSITISTNRINNPEECVLKLKKSLKMLRYGKTGPILLSCPKDVLEGAVDKYLIDRETDFPIKINVADLNDKVNRVIKLIENAKKPLILVGAGVFWSKAADKLLKFAEKYQIPVSTTYPARGVFSNEHPLFLGMIGVRGTEASNFAGKHADVLISLGSRLSERTMAGIGECKIIQINLDENSHKGYINIKQDVGDFLDLLIDLKVVDREEWLEELGKYPTSYKIRTDYNEIPIKPQRAIKDILDASQDSIVVNDAGSHTTWVTLLQRIKKPSSFVFSGGFAPMGYGIPAAVGASLAEPRKSIVVIVGDGGFQMTSQELATIKQLNLPVTICLLNNQSLGIIKQWQRIHYDSTYEVDLENPDFVKLAKAYNIGASCVNSPGDIYSAVKKAVDLKRPYLVEVIIDRDEEIPLPETVV